MYKTSGVLLLMFAFCVAVTKGVYWFQQGQNQAYSKSVIEEEDTNIIDSWRKQASSPSSVSLGTTDPLFSAGFFEGDIVGINLKDLSGRNAVNIEEKLWQKGTIPYQFRLFSFSFLERQVILFALEEFQQQTCIRFHLRTKEDTDYVEFIKGKGCYSHVGRVGGRQEVSIGDGCGFKGIIMHEVNHVLGFWHEQSRPDRDDYIVINWENIQKGTEANFAKYPLTIVQDLNEIYDYNSLMHYGPFSFARYKNVNTIRPKLKVTGLHMGQRTGFTSVDIRKINKLYNCTFTMQPSANIIMDVFAGAAKFIQAVIQRLE